MKSCELLRYGLLKTVKNFIARDKIRSHGVARMSPELLSKTDFVVLPKPKARPLDKILHLPAFRGPEATDLNYQCSPLSLN